MENEYTGIKIHGKLKVSSDQNHKSRTVVTTTSWHVKIWGNVCNILINFSPDIGQITVTPIGQFADHWIMTLTVKVTSFIQSFLPIPHRQRNLNISAQIGSSHDIPPVTLMLVTTQLSSCTPAIFWNHFDALYPGSDATWAEYNYTSPAMLQGLLHSYIQSLTSVTGRNRGGYFLSHAN